MLSRADRLRPLRVPVAFALILLGVAAGASRYAWHRYETQVAVERDRATFELRIRRETAAMKTTVADAAQYATAYDRLVRAGVVGPWHKLAAIDRFEAAMQPWQGRVGRYTVGAIASTSAGDAESVGVVASVAAAPVGIALDLPPAGALPAGQTVDSGQDDLVAHRFVQARISVELQPIDAPDLLAALDVGSRSAIGISDIERCRIGRRGDDGAELEAACTLAWHSFMPTNPAVTRHDDEPSSPAPGSARPLRSAGSIELGRLFLTPQRRRRGPVEAHANETSATTPRPHAATPEAPAPKRVQGYLRRSDGPDVVWIDDAPAILANPAALSQDDARVAAGAQLRPLTGSGWRRSAAPPAK